VWPAKSQKGHFSGVAVLYSRWDLNEHAGADIVSMIVDRKITHSGQNIVGARNLPTEDKGIVPLFRFYVEDLVVLLLKGSKCEPKKALSPK
jgi:hypothetical protein